MKQFFKILFACLSAIILFIMIAFVSLIGIAAGSSSSDKTVVKKNSVLLLDLTSQIAEQSKENSLGAFTGEPTSTDGLNDIIASIHAAKTDDKIKGIYIKMGPCPNGWATLQEIREAISDFKTSNKFVYSYGEVADQKSYYIASAGEKVFLNPSGMIEFVGLSINGMFYKETFDKLDIKTEAFHCGKFKGAYEPYKLDKFSEPNRFQLKTLLDDLYAQFLQAASEKSSIDTTTLSKMANEGTIKFPSDAVRYKMIDATVYGDSVEAMIRAKLGITEKDKINFVSSDDYSGSIDVEKEDDKIAILYAEGAIYDGTGDEDIYSKSFIKQIRKIAKDDKIKSVVLRVNSPGGSALASEVIYHELVELRKKKPIIVSMGNYAASGGYYISCAGDSIIADENTLTGSIGVVGVMFNIGDMMKNKLGVTTDQVKTGQFSDFPNMTRTMTETERAWIQSYLDTTYNLFKSRVAGARHLSMEEVEELAQGHVYSGTLAKSLKLVDRIGNVNDAIESAASKANLKKYSIEEFPKPKDKIEEVLMALTGKKREEAAMKRILGEEYVVYKEIQKIRSQQNQIQAVLPWQLDIK